MSKISKVTSTALPATAALTQTLEQMLERKKAAHGYRQLHPRDSKQALHIHYAGKTYLSFSSNDYLNLSHHPKVIAAANQAAQRYGIGSGGSQLVSGHCAPHHSLQEALADFIGFPAALVFPSAYMSNIAALSTLMKRNAWVFQDRHNHASLWDAALLARARCRRYPHNDIAVLEKQLQATPGYHHWIASDGVFSMNGDLASLSALSALAKTYQTCLLIDDSHGIGIRPPREIAPEAVTVLTGSFGKALGCAGGFIASNKTIIEAITQSARPYIYTTAPPPALCAAVEASLEVITKESWRNTHLSKLIQYFQSSASNLKFSLLPSRTPIQSIIIGSDAAALRVSNALLDQGIFLKAIRTPTVAAGSARLRISLTAAHQTQHIDQLLEAILHATRTEFTE